MNFVFLLLKILPILPSLIMLLPQFKGAKGWDLLKLIAEIVRLIMGLAPKDKVKANALMSDLKVVLANAPDKDKLAVFHDKVKVACLSRVGCPPDLKNS